MIYLYICLFVLLSVYLQACAFVQKLKGERNADDEIIDDDGSESVSYLYLSCCCCCCCCWVKDTPNNLKI